MNDKIIERYTALHYTDKYGERQKIIIRKNKEGQINEQIRGADMRKDDEFTKRDRGSV